MKRTRYTLLLAATCGLLIAGQGGASKHSVEPHTPPHTSSKGPDWSKAQNAPAAEAEAGAKVIQYGDKDIVRLKTKLRYTTLIVLPKSEQILDFTCGDKELWVVNGNQNFAYVKPAKAGAKTNLNLVTASGNIYSFALTEVSELPEATPDLKVFIEPKEESMISAASAAPRFVSAQEVEDYKQQVAIAKEENRQAKQACQAAIDSGISKFLANMRFPYRFEAGKRPFFVRAMYQDDKFTYIQARPEETPTLYEVQDGKPNLINFEYRNGVYVAEKIVDQGYPGHRETETRLQTGTITMSNTNPDPTTTPQVQDKRARPLGILPQNMQVRVLGGVAALMVIVIALSGRNPPKQKSLPPPAPVVDPNATRIQEYEKAVAEQTRKLQLEQAQLARTQQALGLPPSSGIGAGAAPPYSNHPYLYSRQPDLPSPAPGSSPESAIQADLTKREYESRFASNIALSYRQGATGLPPSLLANPLLAAPQNIYSPGWAAAMAAPAPPMLPLSLPVSATPEMPGKTEPGTPSPRDGDGEERNSKSRRRDNELNRVEGKRYLLFEGTVLEAVLTNRLDGSFSGPVNCMVTTNVYSHNGLHLLIPQGSRILGEVKRVETFGQQRLAIMFHRLIMPDGYSVSLDKFQGLNQVGETGLVDQVNRHYMQVFGVSLAIGAIAGLSQANTRYGLDESAADAYRQGVATSLSQSSLRILDRYLNVLPTFTIREVHRVKVYLSDDLLLPAYDQHQMPSDL